MGDRSKDETPPPGYIFISPSQLKLFLLGCERKWGFQYILKLRAPSGRGAALGTLVHDQLEKYLRDGTPLDFTIKDAYGVYPAEVAAVGLQHLPEPKSPGLKVEGYFKFQVPECPGIIFRGFKDYSVEPHAREDGLPHIGDHKTCRSWAYALTADELKGDIQAIMYAKEAFLMYPDAPAVTLQWGYLGTEKKYRAQPVRCTITRADVDHVWSEIVLASNRLLTTLQSKAAPLSLPFNAEECPKYSKEGCPFRGTCNLSPQERRPFNMSNAPTSNLLDRVKARQAAATGVPAEVTQAAGTKGLSPVQAKLAAAKAAKAAAPPAPPPEATRTLAEITAPVAPPAAPPPFVPPTPSAYAAGCEPPAPPADVIPAAFAPPPPMPKSDQPINCPSDFQPPPAVADQAVAVAPALTELVAPKAKGGRPAGSTNKAKPADADQELLDLMKRALKKYLGEAS